MSSGSCLRAAYVIQTLWYGFCFVRSPIVVAPALWARPMEVAGQGLASRRIFNVIFNGAVVLREHLPSVFKVNAMPLDNALLGPRPHTLAIFNCPIIHGPIMEVRLDPLLEVACVEYEASSREGGLDLSDVIDSRVQAVLIREVHVVGENRIMATLFEQHLLVI